VNPGIRIGLSVASEVFDNANAVKNRKAFSDLAKTVESPAVIDQALVDAGDTPGCNRNGSAQECNRFWLRAYLELRVAIRRSKGGAA